LVEIFLVGSVNFVYFCRSDVSAVQALRSSEAIDFGTNRKRVCDFLLVRNSNLGPILRRFGDIACAPFILCAPDPIPILTSNSENDTIKECFSYSIQPSRKRL